MATMNVSLPDPMKTWVEARLKDGSFSNTSDYVRHLIRRDQERAMILAALEASAGKVFGPGGAAERLGLKPTTLASRIKRLGIQKPPRRAASG